MTYKQMPLTADELRSMIDYSPDSGELRWKIPRRKRVVGGIAGCPHVSTRGARRITVGIDGFRYMAHCLIWLWMTGVWPRDEIDHKDGNGWNNRWENLREATRTQNNRNVRKTNKSTGVRGVRRTKSGTYQTRICVDRHSFDLGTYSTLDKAVAAYESAAIQYHGEFSRPT